MAACHAETHLPIPNRRENISDRDVALRKAQVLRQALAYAKDHRCQGNGRGVFYQMLLIPHGKPDAAGRPYSVILRRSALQFPHNVDGPLIVHLNTDIQIVRAPDENLLQFLIFRTGKNPDGVFAATGGKVRVPHLISTRGSISTCGPASSTSERSRQKAEAKHCRQPSHPFHPTLLLLLLLRLLPLLPLYCNTFLLLSINPL